MNRRSFFSTLTKLAAVPFAVGLAKVCKAKQTKYFNGYINNVRWIRPSGYDSMTISTFYENREGKWVVTGQTSGRQETL